MHVDERIRITIVDNHELMCDGLRALFRNQSNMEVIGEAEDEAEAIRLAREHKSDVTILNVDMPGVDVIGTTRQLLQHFPDIKIIALSMSPRKALVAEMLTVGVSGYVLNDHTFSELIKAIKVVVKANEMYLCPKITSIVVGDYISIRSIGKG